MLFLSVALFIWVFKLFSTDFTSLLPITSDLSLSALANEVEALRAALLQREQQVQSLTRPIPLPASPPFTTSGLVTTPGHMNPPFTTSGLITTSGLTTTQTYLPVSGVAPAVVEGPSNVVTISRSAPVMTPMVTTTSGLGTNSYVAYPGQVHHHHYFSQSTGRGTNAFCSISTQSEYYIEKASLSGLTSFLFFYWGFLLLYNNSNEPVGYSLL